MADRATIARIFWELTDDQLKRAKGFLRDEGVPAGRVQRVNDAEDMADEINQCFEEGDKKMKILDILKKTNCEDVIGKYKDYLFDSPQHSGRVDGSEARSSTRYVPPSGTQTPTLARRKKLYIELNNKLGKGEEEKMRQLLEGEQLNKRDLQGLSNVAAILIELDNKGHFENGFMLLKELLTQIERRPLIKLVEKCEQDMAR